MSDDTVKKRLTEFIDYLGVTRLSFEQSIGKSNGWASKPGNSIRDDVKNKLSEIYPNLNIGWLLTGEGTMLNTNSPSISTRVSGNGSANVQVGSNNKLVQGSSDLKVQIAVLEKENELLREQRELLLEQNNFLKTLLNK